MKLVHPDLLIHEHKLHKIPLITPTFHKSSCSINAYARAVLIKINFYINKEQAVLNLTYTYYNYGLFNLFICVNGIHYNELKNINNV
ncbi:hypothetical protein bcgnr5372_10680 [Bacillus luti]|nr:hypothetical protein BCM0074_4365 [Bacillus cereus]